jgi:two-component system phosphate regulon sensor histidine kinase PhoR
VRRPRLFWRIYATYLVIVIICTAAVGFYAVRSVRDFYYDQTERDLQARAALIRDQLTSAMTADTPQQLENLVRRLDSVSGTRITLIAADRPGVARGQVLADSEANPATLPNHTNRPEFQIALQGRPGRVVRYSDTLHQNMMYVAIPVTENGRITTVLRTAIPLTRVNDALATLYGSIGISALVVAVIAALIGWYMSRGISRQMADIKIGAQRLAAGDFTQKLYVPRVEEFASVAESINQMAEELDDRLRRLTHERNEREAVLASMVEGVLAVDTEERVIAVNAAAARLLESDPAEAEGKSIQEIVRNPDLQYVVAQTLAGQRPVEADIVIRVGAEDRNLQANGTLLHGDGEGDVVGAVVVLNDVTRLKRLEAVRRDFVANVSHELKTPVTSIKGFAETLEDGALDDPTAARRFVRIISGQADRLNSIIEDLLALSTLEQSGDSRSPSKYAGPKQRPSTSPSMRPAPAACSRASALPCSSRPW